MQYLYRRKIVLLSLLLIGMLGTKAQRAIELNLPDHDDKLYYFGIILGQNMSHYNITHHPYFLSRDTIQVVNSKSSGSIHMGIMANLQLSNRLDLRAYPLNLIFSQKKFSYTQQIPNQPDNNFDKKQEKTVESIVMSFPIQVRLKSDRINNFRVYTLAGLKYDFDLASNSNARNADDIVKVKKDKQKP